MSKDTKTKKPIRFKREKLSDEDLMRLYKGILLPRMIEEKERNEVLPSEYFHQKEAMNANIITVEDPKEDENG